MSFCSFVDRDMFMRHFGHGVGHLQYERQHEIDSEPNPDTNMGQTLKDASDKSDSDSDNPDTGDSDNVIVDWDGEEEEEEYDSEIVNLNDEEGDMSISELDSDSDGTQSDCESHGYASY